MNTNLHKSRTINLTTNEEAVITALLKAGNARTESPTLAELAKNKACYAGVIDISAVTGIPTTSLRGVLGSLSKKGLVQKVSDDDGHKELLTEDALPLVIDLLEGNSVGQSDEVFEVKPVRKGTKRETLLRALVRGATQKQIDKICVKEDGTPWSDASRISARSTFWRSLGYKTKREGNKFFVLLPKGVSITDCIV